MKQPTLYPQVILDLPDKDDDFLPAAKGIVAAMDGNTNFPNAGLLLDAAKAAITPYAKAMDDAKSKLPDAVTVRRDARRTLKKALAALRDHVQTVVDSHLDQAATIAASAKMRLRKVPQVNKQALAADDGPISGSVELVAKAIVGALLYFWEYSVDQKSWTAASDSSAARAVITGLTVGQTYYFRFRARTRKKGMTDYSQVVNLLVR